MKSLKKYRNKIFGILNKSKIYAWTPYYWSRFIILDDDDLYWLDQKKKKKKTIPMYVTTVITRWRYQSIQIKNQVQLNFKFVK